MASVMLLGTLNRVMIVELSVPALIVASMIALPVLIAPFRALLGFRSDNYRSAIGWKRVPYLWFGSLWQMGGLAIMPFSLMVLSGDQTLGPSWAGEVLAALAFIMTGIGLHMTQTAGLALASDRASDENRPRVVALLYVMFLVGMGISALIIGWLLRDFTSFLPMSKEDRLLPKPVFREAFSDLIKSGQTARLICVVFLGTIAFNMQDVLLEPFGGEVLGLSVGKTTWLTASWALGALLGLAYAAHRLDRNGESTRLMRGGLLVGLIAFPTVIFSAPLESAVLFFIGALLIGFGAGLFSVATLILAMTIPISGIAGRGLAIGAWGAAQATAAGISIALGGFLRDLINYHAMRGAWGEALATPATGYSFVYHSEIALLIVTLLVLFPLIRQGQGIASKTDQGSAGIRLADFPM